MGARRCGGSTHCGVCDCGCGAIEFVLDGATVPRSEAANPVPVEGVVADPDGGEVGGLILFVRDGMLQSLEIYSYAAPLPLPQTRAG